MSNMVKFLIYTIFMFGLLGSAYAGVIERGASDVAVVDAKEACAKACPSGYSCDEGACVADRNSEQVLCGILGLTCQTGFTCCNFLCVNLQSNQLNCGACRIACPLLTSTCVSGVCTCTNPNERVCGIRCTNVMTDPTNCGRCGNICQLPTLTCVNGVCM